MELPVQNKITHCLGYWQIGGNIKRPPEHYERLLPLTLQALSGRNLVFIYDDHEAYLRVFDLCRQNRINLIGISMEIEDLPAWQLSGHMLEACKSMRLDKRARPKKLVGEKGDIHYWRDYKGSGEIAYRKLITVWMSKIPLVANIVDRNPFDTPWFCWTDASVARFEGKRTNWDFRQVEFPSVRISHYASIMQYMGRRLPLNASFLMGDAAAWAQFSSEFDNECTSVLGDTYAHDEETIISRVYRRQPELFYTIGAPIRGRRNIFSSVISRLTFRRT